MRPGEIRIPPAGLEFLAEKIFLLFACGLLTEQISLAYYRFVSEIHIEKGEAMKVFYPPCIDRELDELEELAVIEFDAKRLVTGDHDEATELFWLAANNAMWTRAVLEARALFGGQVEASVLIDRAASWVRIFRENIS